jgi:hypothetical protein
LLEENKRRNRLQPEFELADTGVFSQSRYFDVQCEYAKNAPDDILIRITVTNRGPEAANVHVLPTLWYRNFWSWGSNHEGCEAKPHLAASGARTVACEHPTLGRFTLQQEDAAPLLFTENETNTQRLFHSPNATPYVKDAFHDYVVAGRTAAPNALPTTRSRWRRARRAFFACACIRPIRPRPRRKARCSARRSRRCSPPARPRRMRSTPTCLPG